MVDEADEKSSPTRLAGVEVKGNMDIELAVDAMRLSSVLMIIIVCSTGDGDFRSLVAALSAERQARECRLDAADPTSMVADEELRRQADQFIEI